MSGGDGGGHVRIGAFRKLLRHAMAAALTTMVVALAYLLPLTEGSWLVVVYFAMALGFAEALRYA